MKTRLIKILAVLAVSASLTNCSLSDDTKQNCNQIIGVSTIGVIGARNATVNEEVELGVSYRIADACGDFYNFKDQVVSATEKKIIVYATYDACNCDRVLSTKTEIYKFKATTPGTYKLRFATTNDVFVDHVIIVE